MLPTRGFFGRRVSSEDAVRLPPGQYKETGFPVLSAGPTPRIKLDDWKFTLKVGPRPVKSWTWAEFNALPQTKMHRDIHCVTKWSKFDTNWAGVTVEAILAAAGLDAPPTPYVLAHSFDDYSTNVPFKDLTGEQAMVATSYEGYPITGDHGGPARLFVPHLYFWKSAKWSTACSSPSAMSRGSGNSAAITSTATRGKNSGLRAIEPQMSDAVPIPPRLVWQQATVQRVTDATPTVKSFFVKVPDWHGFRAGQHVDVRLSSPDGYQAERSYSIGSAPESDIVELVIERLENGEVSGFFHEVVQPGDSIELRGPIGGHFVWALPSTARSCSSGGARVSCPSCRSCGIA